MTNHEVEITENDLVLVTGASGYLASHIVKQLLEQGHRVRGTVRSLANDKKVQPLRNLVPNAKHELELVEADLMDEKSWIDAVKGCTYVIHTASPVPNYVPKDENEVIKPAVNGVNNVFNACVQEDSLVKRVVFTSSIAAISGDSYVSDKPYSETDFFETKPDSQPYIKSKVLAEQAAWDFIKKREESKQPCFELVVINPGFIIGPVLHDTLCSSMEIPKRLMCKELPLVPDICLPGCDVRDIAFAHIKCLTSPEVVSKRHVLVANNKAETLKDYAQWLNEEFGSKGYSVPTKLAPSLLLRFIGIFSKEMALLVPMLGKSPQYDNSRFTQVLKIDPIDPKKSIIDMGYSMIERGFIPKKF